jgi:hypothetical protein
MTPTFTNSLIKGDKGSLAAPEVDRATNTHNPNGKHHPPRHPPDPGVKSLDAGTFVDCIGRCNDKENDGKGEEQKERVGGAAKRCTDHRQKLKKTHIRQRLMIPTNASILCVLPAVLFLLFVGAKSQVACTAIDDSPVCKSDTKCNPTKADNCLRCNSDLDCISCTANYYLNNQFKCEACPAGRTSPVDSKSILDCEALTPTVIPFNFTNRSIPVLPVVAGYLEVTGLILCIVGVSLSCCCWLVGFRENAFEDSDDQEKTVFIGGCICIGMLLLPLVSLITVATYICPQGTMAGGNICIVCPMGTYEVGRQCTKCPQGRFQLYAGDFEDDDYNNQTLPCYPCTTPDCSKEICREVTDGGENEPGCMCLHPSVEHSPANDLASSNPWKSFTQVTGGEICTQSTGLACKKGACSASACGGACCPIKFDSKDILGCAQSNEKFCSDIASGLFVRNPIDRVDVAVNCGKETACQRLHNAKDAITTIYTLNLIDMVIEIFVFVFWFVLFAVQFKVFYNKTEIKENQEVLARFKLGTMFLTVLPDFVLQIWVLVLVDTHAPVLLELEESRCLDTTTINGQSYQKTLIGLVEDLSAQQVLGGVEILLACFALALEFHSASDDLKKAAKVAKSDSDDDDDKDDNNQSIFTDVLTFGSMFAAMMLAIIEFAILTTPSYNSMVALLSSTVTSGEWCMAPMNETLNCIGLSRIEKLSGGITTIDVTEQTQINHSNQALTQVLAFFLTPFLLLGCGLVISLIIFNFEWIEDTLESIREKRLERSQEARERQAVSAITVVLCIDSCCDFHFFNFLSFVLSTNTGPTIPTQQRQQVVYPQEDDW